MTSIADKFKTEAQVGCISAMYTAIVALEEKISKIAHMLDLQNSWNEATSTRVEIHSNRLAVLEAHPSQSPDTGREWIPVHHNLEDILFRVMFVDKSDGLFTIKEFPGLIGATHIMPYIPGEPAPAAPKESVK